MGGSAANRVTSASASGTNATTLGGAGGAETHTLITAEMPAHTHTLSQTYGGNSGSGTVGWGNDGSNLGTSSPATSSTGGGGAHSNTQPWLALNYIIKH